MKLTQKKAAHRGKTIRPRRQGLEDKVLNMPEINSTLDSSTWEPIGGGQKEDMTACDPQARLSNWRLLFPSPDFGMYVLFTVPIVEVISKV